MTAPTPTPKPKPKPKRSMVSQLVASTLRLAERLIQNEDRTEFYAERIVAIEDRLARLDGGPDSKAARPLGRQNLINRRIAAGRPTTLTFQVREDD